MDEKGLVERLNRDLDILLDGHPLPAPHDAQVEAGEYEAVLQIARQLARNDMSSQSRVRGALKQKLLNRLRHLDHQEVWEPKARKGNHSMSSKHRPIAFALTALIVLVIAIALTPAGQALAQNVWQRVGPLLIISGPAQTPEPALTGATATPLPGAVNEPAPLPAEDAGQAQPADPSASPTPLPLGEAFPPLSDAMALEKYGFRVLQPKSLPSDYQLSEHQVNQTQDGRIVSIFIYTTASTPADGRYLSIQQSTFKAESPVEFQVGDANVRQVSVRGFQATWIEDVNSMTIQDESGKNISLPMDYLMWEENGVFFLLNATQLTQAELIQIAESLQ